MEIALGPNEVRGSAWGFLFSSGEDRLTVMLHYAAFCKTSVLFQGHWLDTLWNLNHHFIPEPFLCGRALCSVCSVHICFLFPHKAPSLSNRSPRCLWEVVAMATRLLLSHIWNKEEERRGLQHYAADRLRALCTEIERKGGGRGGCIQDIRTFLQIREERETDSSQHQHLTSQQRLVRTLNALLSMSASDKNTGKTVACFTSGDNKKLFIHNGTKHLLHTWKRKQWHHCTRL